MVGFLVPFVSRCLSCDTGRDTSALKHGKGRNSDIVLVPQPSDSPRDPLNWPQWKKELLLLIISIDTAVVGAWGKSSFMVVAIFSSMSRIWQLRTYMLTAGPLRHTRR
jgi:hypothetical protein